ncbi:MAG: hypothetical protein ACKVU0_17140 [Saprospiraceae bacterium]
MTTQSFNRFFQTLIILSVLILNFSLLYAQSPQGFKYQGVARNAANQPISSQNIALRLSIVLDPDGDGDGPLVYRERHQTTTSDLGVFSLNIGQGTVLSGTFANIIWGGNLHALRTELDPMGGNTFTFMGSSPILSVPYALHAETASSANSESQTLALNGTQLSISQGNTVDLNGIGGGGSSPWLTNGTNVFYNNGSVGIGTNAPTRHLEIRGADDRFIRIHATNGGSSETGIELLRGNTAGTDWRISNDGGELGFTQGSDNFLTEANRHMTLTAVGNLGLGTDAPARKMEIRENIAPTLRLHAFNTSGSTEAGIEMVRGNASSGTDWKMVNDGGVLRIKTGADNFATDGQTVAEFSSTGNLNLQGNELKNIAAPVAGTDAVNRDWVTGQLNTTLASANTYAQNQANMAEADANSYTQTYVQQYFEDNFTNSPQNISPMTPDVMTLPEAATYCRNLVYGGYTDWRLPPAEDLVHYWGYPGMADVFLWTSTPFSYVDVEDGYSVNFVYYVTINPNATSGGSSKSHFNSQFNCRCVR